MITSTGNLGTAHIHISTAMRDRENEKRREAREKRLYANAVRVVENNN